MDAYSIATDERLTSHAVRALIVLDHLARLGVPYEDDDGRQLDDLIGWPTKRGLQALAELDDAGLITRACEGSGLVVNGRRGRDRRHPSSRQSVGRKFIVVVQGPDRTPDQAEVA